MVLGEVRVANLTKNGSGRDDNYETRKLVEARTYQHGMDSAAKAKSYEWTVFRRGGVCVPVHFGSFKTSKEKAIVVMCNDFSKGT